MCSACVESVFMDKDSVSVQQGFFFLMLLMKTLPPCTWVKLQRSEVPVALMSAVVIFCSLTMMMSGTENIKNIVSSSFSSLMDL